MYEGTFIIASGPVIVEDGKLLVNNDNKDDFYKIPGGTLDPGTENLEEGCIRKFFEENSGKIEIIKPLSPMLIWKNPTTKERMAIMLVHFKAKLLNKEKLKPCGETIETKWLPISEIREGKHNVAPNIKFLLEKGELA